MESEENAKEIINVSFSKRDAYKSKSGEICGRAVQYQ